MGWQCFLGVFWMLVFSIGLTILVIIHLGSIHSWTGVIHTEVQTNSIDIRGTIKPYLVPRTVRADFFQYLQQLPVEYHVPDGCVWLVTSFRFKYGAFCGVLEFRIYCWRVSCRQEGLGKAHCEHFSGKCRHVDDLYFLYDSGIHRTAGDWFIYLLMPDSGCQPQSKTSSKQWYRLNVRVEYSVLPKASSKASPLTAFMIGPIAQFIFIPFTTCGVDLPGTCSELERIEVALLFTVTGWSDWSSR